MKNLYYFNGVVYKGNVDRDFFLYCCQKNKKLYLYIFIHLFYSLLSLFSLKMEKIKKERYHQYINKVDNLDRYIKEFKNKKNCKINKWFLDNHKKGDYVVSDSPKMLIEAFLEDVNIVAADFNKDYTLNFEKYDDRDKIKEDFMNIYFNKLKDSNSIYGKHKYVCKRSLFLLFDNYEKFGKYFFMFMKIILPFALAFLLMLISFTFTTVYLDIIMIKTYLHDGLLLVLNYMPILVLLLILFFVTKRLWVSFTFTSFIVFLIGIINKTKLYYRDDVFVMGDLGLAKEAFIMTTRYDVVLRWYSVLLIIFCIIIVAYLMKYYKNLKIKFRYCLVILIGLIGVSIWGYNKYYVSDEIYAKIGDESIINKWIATRQSQIRGLLYPFIYSSKELIDEPPIGYDESVIKQILSKYSYSNIPVDKKVNIIGIMLEAYNDFSKFDSIEFTEDVYEKLHAIQEKSLHGQLIVDIFGGGTVDTERHFITGYYDLPNFRKRTYSYATYFKEQGYVTEAMHPIYGSFYNRITADLNMGFDNFYYYENTFSKVQDDFMTDSQFYEYIKNGLVSANNDGKKYFNFSVTYQNHGPYTTEYDGNDFIVNNGYSESAYNMFNNYLSGIKSSSEALYELVEFLEDYNEPVVLVFFGDHNPYLGEANYAYTEMGIDLTMTTPESFENYYGVPYVIYANNVAKEVIGKDFVGETANISPMFLMNELFDYMGYKGFDYTQYTSDIKKKIDVAHAIYNKEDGEYISSISSKYKDLVEELNQVSYYYSRKD